ncbi:MAG: tungsten formylmethanofuran dehydrogenase [Xanthobacteraceae bacterium]
MAHAWIAGRAATIEAAAAEAARLLALSRLPAIVGLGTDIAGARAAIALAERLGGVIDHMHSDAVLRDLDVMREAGMMVTTLNEARLRADTVVVIGAGPFTRPELTQDLLAAPTAPEIGDHVKRRVFWLCPGRSHAAVTPAKGDVRRIGRGADELPAVLAALRARTAGRPVNRSPIAAKTLDALAADLQAARFGVAVWSAAELDALVIEMLCGVVHDLNAGTRFSGIAIPPPDNAAGVLQACAWTTGWPMRTGFGRGRPEHDPWRFDATRLVGSREADCVLWISAYGQATPSWHADVPIIAMTAKDTRFRAPPRVHIEIGHPGVDHDAVEHLAKTATLAPVAATEPRDTISVAQAIAHIASALTGAGHADVH